MLASKLYVPGFFITSVSMAWTSIWMKVTDLYSLEEESACILLYKRSLCFVTAKFNLSAYPEFNPCGTFPRGGRFGRSMYLPPRAIMDFDAFSKSSMVWTPLFYLLSNGHIKEAIIEVVFKRKPVFKQDS